MQNVRVLRHIIWEYENASFGMLRYEILVYFGTSFWSIKAHNSGVLNHVIWEY